MVNLQGLATSVHYNITIPEAFAIGDPNQSTSALSPLVTSSFSGQPFSLQHLVYVAQFKSPAYPSYDPSVLHVCFFVVLIIMPRNRSDCQSRLGPGSRSTERASVSDIPVPSCDPPPSSPVSSSTLRQDTRVSMVPDTGLSMVCSELGCTPPISSLPRFGTESSQFARVLLPCLFR